MQRKKKQREIDIGRERMNSFGYTPFPFLSSSVIIFGKKDPSDIQRTAIDNNDDVNDNNNNEEEAEDRHIYSVNCNGG